MGGQCEVEVLEIDALPQERGDRFTSHRLRPACAGHAVPLVPDLAAPHPGLARGERAADRGLMCDDRWLV